MSAENWHEERNRIVELLEAIESGKVTHIDEENLRQLAPINPKNIALLRERLAQLNARLGDKSWLFRFPLFGSGASLAADTLCLPVKIVGRLTKHLPVLGAAARSAKYQSWAWPAGRHAMPLRG